MFARTGCDRGRTNIVQTLTHLQQRCRYRPRLECLESRIALAAGVLDPSFDGDGVRTMGAFVVADVAIQGDGRIVAVGPASGAEGADFGIMRFNADGSIDETFGSSGLVTTNFGPSTDDFPASVVIQPDGKIVVAGHSDSSGNLDMALARYNVDGTLDTSFGREGLVTTALRTDTGELIRSVALQADGRIIVAGKLVDPYFGFFFCMARYNLDGSLDADFAGAGIVTVGFAEGGVGFVCEAYDVAAMPDGRIVVLGTIFESDIPRGFALARLHPDGTLDSTFDSDGTVITHFNHGSYDTGRTLALQPDGKILAAGTTGYGGSSDNFGLARYDLDGSLDSSFSYDGKVVTDFFRSRDEANSLVLQSDGKIVVAGLAVAPTPLGPPAMSFAVARYHPAGTLDHTFGDFGKVTTAIGAEFYGGAAVAFAAAIQLDGAMVVGGGFTTGFFAAQFAMARYLGDPASNGIVAVGSDAGVTNRVQVFDAVSGELMFDLQPFGSYSGGVRVAVGDVNSDGTPDVVAATGAGIAATVRVYNGATGTPFPGFLGNFQPFGLTFRNGLYVATGDVNGDGADDVILGTGEGAAPRVTVRSGLGPAIDQGTLLAAFRAFDGRSKSGVRVAAGDVTGDGRDDIIVGRASRGAAHVRVFDGQTFRPIAGPLGNLLAFDADYRGGIFVAAGDVNGDGRADVLVAAGAGEPRVKAFDGAGGRQLMNFLAYDAAFRGGVRLAAGDANGDGRLDILTGQGPGGEDEMRLFEPLTAKEIDDFFGATTRGVFIAVG